MVIEMDGWMDGWMDGCDQDGSLSLLDALLIIFL